MTTNDRNDVNDIEHGQESETATQVAEGQPGSSEPTNTSHESPAPAARRSSDKQRQPYSVFTGWDRYAIVAMVSWASFYRYV